MKKIILYVLSLILVLGIFIPVFAAEQKIYLNLFYSESCSHCTSEREFLDSIKDKYPVEISEYEISDKDNRKLLNDLIAEYKVDVSGVPVLFIGKDAISGFVSSGTTGVTIENKIKEHLSEKQCTDIVREYKENCIEEEQIITLPLFGKVNLSSLSLPVLAITLGIVDGFNPCAMWALVALLAVLVATRSKKRILTFGGVFIFISALVYFLFMAAWLKVFQWIGYIEITKIVIGVGALAVAIYYFRDFYINRDPECKVTPSKTKSKLLEWMRGAVNKYSWPLALLVIVFLAFSVNLIELLCSMGLPAIFTRTLTLYDLSSAQYFFYMFLYILFYIIDDIIIFLIAVKTLQIVGIKGRYARYTKLIGAILLVVLGMYLLLR